MDLTPKQATWRKNEHPRPPLGDIRMIIGGTTTSCSTRKACKTYLRMVQNVQLTGFILKMVQIDNLVIEFIEEDARCLHHPHDNAFVVSIWMGITIPIES